MKILYDYQIFLNQSAGGPSRYYYNLINEISKKHLIKVCAPLHINDYLINLDKNQVYGYKIDNFFFNNTSYKIKEFLKYKILNKINLYFQNKKIIDFKPNIIHRTYYDDYNTNLPVVLTVYDLIHEKYHEMYGKDKNFRPKKKAIDRADIIICISKNTLKDLNYYYDLNDKKTEVVYLGSNIDYKTKKKNINKILKNNYLLFVGKRTGYKNFVSLLKAYSKSEKLQKDFMIKCFGGGKLTKNEIKLILDLKISLKNIIFIQGSDEQLIDLYQNASALIYPSKYEGFGLPLLEAMSFDCPVLCSNTSSLPEVGGDAVKYFDPENWESILNSILSVVYSNSKSNDLRSYGREQIKKFNWKDCSNKTIQIYKELI